jgi:hypothetical protein
MSPRAEARLATIGYDVYDYAPGKVDWMAHGLAVQGTAATRPTTLTLVHEHVATCTLDEPPDEVTRRVDASPYGFALALSPDRVVLGRVRRSRLADAPMSVDAVLEQCAEGWSRLPVPPCMRSRRWGHPIWMMLTVGLRAMVVPLDALAAWVMMT